MYYTYMLRCSDNSIYTGITTDLNRRMNEHFNKLDVAAKYTHSHTAVKLERDNKSLASRLEYYIKHLSKADKEMLILCGDLDLYLGDKIDVNEYRAM